MNDQQANVTIEAVLELALTLRDDGPDPARPAAQRVLDAAGGDPVAALAVAAALIRVDAPVDRWWQGGLAGIGRVEIADLVGASPGPRRPRRYRGRRSGPRPVAPCGTHAAFNRHKSHGEHPCPPCVEGEAAYHAARPRRREVA